MNLMDLVSGMPGGGAPATAPQGGLDPSIEAAIAAASQPEPTVDAPVPKQSKLWQRILSAIADAGSAYGAGMGAGRPTEFTARMLYRDREAQDIDAGNQARKQKAGRDAGSKAAELRLRALIDKQDREARRADETIRLEQQRQQKAEDRAAKAEQDAAELAGKKEILATEIATRERMAKNDQAHDMALANLRAQHEGGSKVAQEQLKTLGEAKAGVNQIANNLPRLMKGYTDQTGEHAPLTPEQVDTMFRRSVAELNLGKDATDAIQAYYDKEVRSQFQALAGGGATGSW